MSEFEVFPGCWVDNRGGQALQQEDQTGDYYNNLGERGWPWVAAVEVVQNG